MAQDNNTAPKNTKQVFAEGEQPKAKISRRSQARHTNGRRGFNAFDIAVVVLLLAVIAVIMSGTQLKMLFRLQPDSTPCMLEYTIMFSDVDEDFAYAIAGGDAVYHPDSKAAMGTVSADPEVQTHNEVMYANGQAQMQSKPGSVDVIITIRTEAEYVEGEGYTVGASVIRVGNSISLRFPRYSGVGSCIHIKEADGSAAAK